MLKATIKQLYILLEIEKGHLLSYMSVINHTVIVYIWMKPTWFLWNEQVPDGKNKLESIRLQ